MASKILRMDSNCNPGTVAYHEHMRAGQAAARGGNGKPNFARAMGLMLKGWEEYAQAYAAEYGLEGAEAVPGYCIGDDGVLGDAWEKIGKGLIALLDGPTGGFDGGSLWSNIAECLNDNGVDKL